MNLLKNLKISQKILSFVALAAMFICIVGLTGFYFTMKGSSGMAIMYKDNFLAIKVLNENRSHLRANEANLLWLVLTKDNNKQVRYLDDIKIRATKFNKNIELYEKTDLDQTAKEKLARAKEILKEYRNIRTKIIDLTTHGKNEQAYEYFNTNKDGIDDTNNILKELAEYKEKVATQIYTQNKKDTAESTMIIIITIISALVSTVTAGLWIARMISVPINKVVGNLNEVAKGNLAVSDVHIDSKDETGILANSLNTTVKNLHDLIRSVSKSVGDISASSQEMSASSDQTAQGAQQTAISTAQLAQGAQQISTNVEQGAINISKLNNVIQGILGEAQSIASLGNETESDANAGNQHVKKAVGKIDSIKNVSEDISVTIAELGKLSMDIEQIVDLIKSIAGQTNLLALNAAIEAARAGEHGKGFAVVAEEVKKLAGDSANATDKITSMIKEIQNKTKMAVSKMDTATNEVAEGVFVINDAGQALENIIEQVKTTNRKIQGITKDIDGVSKSSEEVVKMIENISAITQETAAGAEEISSITEEQTATLEEMSANSQMLAKIAEGLNKEVSVFKI